MSNISNGFNNGKAFIAYLNAGDPNICKTKEYIKALAEGGADIIEIGVPFSDPMAEGPTIQKANCRALKNGINLNNIFLMVEELRRDIDVPLVFLIYYNTVYVYGEDKFFKECMQAGVDGVIIPDLPYEESGNTKKIAGNYNVDLITLIAPTSDERIKLLAEDASGFIYLVSSMGVTGVRDNITTDLKSIVSKIQATTDIPIAVGFGISTTQQAAGIADYCDGVIVGSAIVNIIENEPECYARLKDYAKSMKQAINIRQDN